MLNSIAAVNNKCPKWDGTLEEKPVIPKLIILKIWNKDFYFTPITINAVFSWFFSVIQRHLEFTICVSPIRYLYLSLSNLWRSKCKILRNKFCLELFVLPLNLINHFIFCSILLLETYGNIEKLFASQLSQSRN